jgi:hypothetical protein
MTNSSFKGHNRAKNSIRIQSIFCVKLVIDRKLCVGRSSLSASKLLMGFDLTIFSLVAFSDRDYSSRIAS